jgi:hypothetical protein
MNLWIPQARPRLKGWLLAGLAERLRVASVPAPIEGVRFDPSLRDAGALALVGTKGVPADQPASGGAEQRGWVARGNTSEPDGRRNRMHEYMNL